MTARARAPRGLRLGACVAACLALLALAGAAQAAVQGGAQLTFPTAMTVGDTGQPAVLTIANINNGADNGATNTVCNAGEGSPCIGGEPGIVIVPSCKTLLMNLCSPAGADPGVLGLSATGAGRPGSTCSGLRLRRLRQRSRDGRHALAPAWRRHARDAAGNAVVLRHRFHRRRPQGPGGRRQSRARGRPDRSAHRAHPAVRRQRQPRDRVPEHHDDHARRADDRHDRRRRA